MVNKNFILALSTIVLGLCGTSAAMVGSPAMVGSSTDSNVVTAQGPQDQSVVPADAVESNPLFKKINVVSRLLAQKIKQPKIRDKIMEFWGISSPKEAARAFSEFKSHAAEFKDLSSRYVSADLPTEIEYLFKQLKEIYNKLPIIDINAITPEDIKTVLQSINEYNGEIEIIRDIRKIAAVILGLINSYAFELNPEARKVLDDYYTPRLAHLDKIENEIKECLNQDVAKTIIKLMLSLPGVKVEVSIKEILEMVYIKQTAYLTEEDIIFYQECMGINKDRFFTKIGDSLCAKAIKILQLQQNEINAAIEDPEDNYSEDTKEVFRKMPLRELFEAHPSIP